MYHSRSVAASLATGPDRVARNEMVNARARVLCSPSLRVGASKEELDVRHHQSAGFIHSQAWVGMAYSVRSSAVLAVTCHQAECACWACSTGT